MPLAASGEMSIGGSTANRSINLEFGRTATQQTSMSQLYRGGGVVPDAASNSAIPTSGTISLSQFYNAANRIAQTITISSNQTNYVANTAKVTSYQAGLMDITFVINSGIVVSSDNTSGLAFDVDTSWAAGDGVTIVNNGTIVGRGGNGGNGESTTGSISPTYSGLTAGAVGGQALRAQRAVSVNNTGTIAGGGGGGGGGGGYWGGMNDPASGGGGGGGRSSLTNSSGGTPGPGGAGTFSSAGVGANGGESPISNGNGGKGGNGGGWGATGATGGSTAMRTGAAGGSAGAAVSGNSNITWVATGTRLGAIT
jgi:hypothetical protein